MRAQSGSAMLFAVVLMSLMALLLLVTVRLSSGVRKSERLAEDRQLVSTAFDGAADLVTTEYAHGTLVPPDSRNFTFGAVSGTVNVTDNSVAAPDTLKLALSATILGQTYTGTRIVPCKVATPSAFYYAIASKSKFSSNDKVVTGSAGSGGDVYVENTIDLDGAGSVVNGDAEVTGNDTSSGLTVTGQETTSASSLPFPSDNNATYQAGATNTLFLNFLPAVIFTPQANGDPRLWYRNGDLTIQGVVSGIGTLYVKGNVTVSGNISYLNGTSKLVLLVNGNLTTDDTTNSIVGYYYVNGTFQNKKALTVNGAIVAGTVKTKDDLTVTYDSYLWKNIAMGPKLYLPGLWP